VEPIELDQVSPYERRRWQEIEEWKQVAATPGKRLVPQKVRAVASTAGDKVAQAWDAIPGNEQIEMWMAEAIQGGFQMTLDLISKSVDEQRIARKVRRHTPMAVSGYDDFASLDLKVLDAAAPKNTVARSTAAAGHGAASGFMAGGATAAGAATGGMGALPAAGAVAGLALADAVALVAGSVQGIASTGAHYGFDPTAPPERAALLNMLVVGTASQGAKVAAMMKVRELALALAAKRTLEQLTQRQLFNLMRRFYAVFLLKTTKKNIAKGVPILGAGLGAGINYAATRRTLEAARYLYPERFLIVKYREAEYSPALDIDVLTIDPEQIDERDRGILERLEDLDEPDVEPSADT
jgi:hypothetical protein